MAFDIDHHFKAYPLLAPPTAVDGFAERQWHVLDDVMPYPLATLRCAFSPSACRAHW